LRKKYFIAILFVIYFAVLVKLIVFKYLPTHIVIADGNYIPLKTILPYLNGSPTWIVAKNNLIGNIALFVPLGFLIPLIYRHTLTWKHILFIAFTVSMALESAQIILRVGVFDVDDIILNVLGAIVGYGAFVYIKSIFRNTRGIQTKITLFTVKKIINFFKK